jgi:allantoate deiminase
MMENAYRPAILNDSTLKAQLASQVQELLDTLSAFGEEEGGGVTRLLYTQAWVDGQQALAKHMARCGLDSYFDQVGNLFGRLEGTELAGQTILTGSHIDTVKSGGNYDGAYGIAASIIALDYLKKTYGSPRRTLEVVSLCEEEGSRFPLAYWGSGSITGSHELSHVEGMKDADGIGFQEAMEAAGFGSSMLKECNRDDLAAFIELHIEQGVILERQDLQLGIVETIVGQKRYTFTVIGEAGHAGTTPMSMRNDAFMGAAHMAAALEEAAIIHGAPLVATVGRMELEPNTPNVIPGKVTFTVDVRHADEAVLEHFCAAMIERFETIALSRNLGFAFTLWMDAKPVHLDLVLAERMERIALGQGASSIRMVSGAGHDTQMFQAICPSALLFVPSHRGISHSPLEYTATEDLAEGILLLIRLLYDLAYEETCNENL